jgi:hypothetical protein
VIVVKEEVLKKVANHLPGSVRSLAKRLYRRNSHWAHPALKKFGTVQDLYYWVADGNLDTLLLLQNYFSALYPGLNTETEGAVSLYGKSGSALGKVPFSIAHCGCAKFRVSSLLEELQVSPGNDFGTLEVNIAIPREVLEHIQYQKAFYFWDRFYIGYVNGQGQTCFVHGVDKTHIYREGKSDPLYWYKKPEGRQWAPEIPVDINIYEKFNVIMINRTSRSTNVSLTLSDSKDNSLSWSGRIPSKGVHRFELTRENTASLVPTELRMRVKGMATQYGRPVVFKEFPNGAISAMHC